MKLSKSNLVAMLIAMTNPFGMFAAIELDKNNYFLGIIFLVTVIALDFYGVKQWFHAQSEHLLGPEDDKKA